MVDFTNRVAVIVASPLPFPRCVTDRDLAAISLLPMTISLPFIAVDASTGRGGSPNPRGKFLSCAVVNDGLSLVRFLIPARRDFSFSLKVGRKGGVKKSSLLRRGA